jgi:hypothetical protein
MDDRHFIYITKLKKEKEKEKPCSVMQQVPVFLSFGEQNNPNSPYFEDLIN